MKCFRCGREYDDTLSACPECGAAAAIPVIPDTGVKIHYSKKSSLPKLKEERNAPVQDFFKSSEPDDKPDKKETSVSGAKKVIAVLATLLVIMAAGVAVLLIDRHNLTADSEPSTYRSSAADDSKKATKNDTVSNANAAALIVYRAAGEYARQREAVGMIVPAGVVCSSKDVGENTPSIIESDMTTESTLKDLIIERLGDDYSGYQWFVCFNGGAPEVAFAAADANTHNIGSFPTEAKNETKISFKDGSDFVNFPTVTNNKSANDIYG
ncbi:MAG: Zn-ribbon domain-containing protein [Ruminococcus sp.]|nr:Zn-ribbon domain-containing protein [Ruminococcus sp.]